MLTWPHPKTDWQNLTEVESVYVQMVKEISLREQLVIVCNSAEHQQHIQQKIQTADAIAACHFVIADSNDCWARDHGPISILQNGKRQLLDFQFNGWGNKYPAQLDNRINWQVFARQLKLPLQPIDFVLEGGSIDTDGADSVLTTSRCLLSPRRNPAYSQQQIEDVLRQSLGIEQILWLHHGALVGDDTDSHIDTLARFCNANTIMYAHCDESDTEHFSELDNMRRELETFRNTEGKAYECIPIPLPAPIYHQGQRLPATYLNFLIINQAVLLPVYQDEKDARVMAIFQSVFKHHKIIPINCLPIIQQFGSLHCLTMQIAETHND